MAIKFDVQFDIPRFEVEVDQYVADVFQPAIVDAINETAKVAKHDLVQSMISHFDRPNPFTLNAIGVYPARAEADNARLPSSS